MAGVLELEPAAAPATVLESEGTGRERRARGFYFGDSGHGTKVGSGRVAAMAAAYELAGGGQRKGRWLGKAEGAVEMLGSCLPWCEAAYRRRSTSGCCGSGGRAERARFREEGRR